MQSRQQFAIAEGIEQIELHRHLGVLLLQAAAPAFDRSPRDQIERLAQGPGIEVGAIVLDAHERDPLVKAALGVTAALTGKREALGHDDFHLRDLVVVPHRGVDQDGDPIGRRMVRGGDGHVFRRAGHGPHEVLGERPVPSSVAGPVAGDIRFRIVAVGRARVAAVGVAHPQVVCGGEVAVNVVPAHVNEPPIVVHARIPFVGLVEADLHLIRAVGFHRVHDGLRGGGAEVAADRQLDAGGDEHDPAVGQPDRVQVVETAVRQLAQIGAIHVDAHDLQGPRRRLEPGKDHFPAVKRKVKGPDDFADLQDSPALERAVLETRVFQQIAHGDGARLEPGQNVEAAVPAARSSPRPPERARSGSTSD